MLNFLTQISLWHDEAFSGLLVKYGLKEMIYRTGLDVHPPLYYILLKGWVGVLGNSPLTLRLSSVFFGALAVFALFLFIKQALKDKKLYPDIIVANEKEFRAGAQPFYTNSSHLPVNYTDDVVETLNIQDNLQTKYTGGTVIHLFLGEQINDTRSVPSLIKKICENYKLPYFTLTPTFSICREHGYLTGEHFLCETCSKECEVYSRIVGYLRPVSQWNAGKRSEYALRKMYNPQKNLSEKTVEQISVVYS